MSANTPGALVRAWGHLRSTPGLGRNAAIVALSVAVAVAVGGYMLSKASFVFPFGRQIISAEFPSVPGTNTTATHKVTMAGVEVGTITGTEVTDRGTALVELNIEPGHPVYQNARAVLRTINPLNEMYIELSPGGPPAPLMADDGIIPIGQTSRPIQADEVLQHLDERSQRAMTALLTESDVALARAPQDLPAGLRATDATLTDLRPVAEKLQTRRELLGNLVTSLSQIAHAAGGDQERIARLANSTQTALGVLAENGRDLQAGLAELPGLNDGLRRALTSTQGLTRELDPTLKELSAASEELPPALDDFTDTVRELGATVEQAQPFVASARPVVRDLRPFVSDVNEALDDTVPITRQLDESTEALIPYLDDLSAFVFNTSSVFGIKDGQGSFIRAYATPPAPDGGSLAGQHGADPPRTENGREAGEVRPGKKEPVIPGLGPNGLGGGN